MSDRGIDSDVMRGTDLDTMRGTDLDAMLEMYGYLREEITQSNQMQQRIVLGLGTFVGAVFGFVFSGAAEEFGQQAETSFALLVAAILPIISVAAGIWLVEQSRVMMAGDYLAHLEHRIAEETDGVAVSWENWLRHEETSTSQAVFDWAYRVGYILFFLGLGLLAVLLFGIEVVSPGLADGRVDPLDVLALLWAGVWSGSLLWISYTAEKVITHDAEPDPERLATVEADQFG